MARKPTRPTDASWSEIREASPFDGLGVPRGLFWMAMHALHRHYNNGRLKRVDVMTLIDFRRAGTEKRLWTVQRTRKKVLVHDYVSHGKNSGRPSQAPAAFSNRTHSKQSSLSSYATGYVGTHPTIGGLTNSPYLTLYGLDKGQNDAAHRRGIWFHGATYVRPGFAGNSHGCFATTDRTNRRLIPVIKGGTFVFVFAGLPNGPVHLPDGQIDRLLDKVSQAIRNSGARHTR